MKTNKLDTELRLIFKRNTMGGSGRVDVESAIPQITALISSEVAKAKIEVLTNFKSDYADDLSVDAYEELIEIISKLQAEASNE